MTLSTSKSLAEGIKDALKMIKPKPKVQFLEPQSEEVKKKRFLEIYLEHCQIVKNNYWR